jgi:methylmalonic aciduria homocystinuria type C protein
MSQAALRNDAPSWRAIREQLAERCTPSGLDVVHAFHSATFDRIRAAGSEIEQFGQTDRLALLIGNTRALWPRFMAHIAACESLAADPLDAFVEARVREALAGMPPLRRAVYWAHGRPAQPFQRLAELSGLASLSPSHLSVHRDHGPWLALRAVVIVDSEPPTEPDRVEREPCAGCEKPCLAPFDHALTRSPGAPTSQDIARHARDWIAVRDACPVGRGARYGEQQLLYHYTGDTRVLTQ